MTSSTDIHIGKPKFHHINDSATVSRGGEWGVVWRPANDTIYLLRGKWFDNEEEARDFYALKLLEWEANR